MGTPACYPSIVKTGRYSLLCEASLMLCDPLAKYLWHFKEIYNTHLPQFGSEGNIAFDSISKESLDEFRLWGSICRYVIRCLLLTGGTTLDREIPWHN
ncbi:hypothetical protein LguiB_021102 [Lonicera macranthoides]